MRTLIAIMIALGCWTLPPAPAHAGKVALVIGNDAYQEVTPLVRAVADARAYRNMLRDERGFDVVYVENADRDTMITKIGEFLGKVRRDDVAMVVYSGHGVQLDPNRGDTLYLLPTDIPSVDPGSGGANFFMDTRAINFARLSSEVDARGAGLRLFVLDACRNNPFPPAEGGRSLGMSRGLGTLRSSRGEFIFFAAAPGEVALDYLPGADDESPNSVFTRVFLKHFRQGSYLEDVANDVQAEVLELSRRAAITQEPYYTDGVAGKTCIDSNCGIAPPPAETDSGLEATYWRLCETRDTPSYCRAYLETYPDGPHAPLAELRVAELEALAAAGARPEPETSARSEPEPEPAPVAASEPEAEPPSETEIAAVDPASTTRGRSQDEPFEAERERMERAARAEWDALAESWDIRAVRDFRARYPAAAQAADAGRRIAFLRDRHAEAQSELNRLGYDAGPVDGLWGRRSAAALLGFQGDQGLRRTGQVESDVLAALKAATPKVATRTTAPRPEPQTEPKAGAAKPERKEPAATQPAQQPAPKAEPEIAALSPATGAIGEGETWKAAGVTNNGSAVSATLTRRGDKLRLEVDFDHRGNVSYYPYLIDRYTKSCTDPASKPEFDCWFQGSITQNRPSSPGARVRGVLPNLRFEAHPLIGSADLRFKPAP